MARSPRGGLHRIGRLMRVNGLKAQPRRRDLPKDHGERLVIADIVLDRDFRADRPNKKLLAYFTYIWTAEGCLYVAAVLNLFSRLRHGLEPVGACLTIGGSMKDRARGRWS